MLVEQTIVFRRLLSLATCKRQTTNDDGLPTHPDDTSHYRAAERRVDVDAAWLRKRLRNLAQLQASAT